MPVKHCLWGTGCSDSRFPQFSEDVRFVPFAKPTHTLETFLRWSKACGHPHSQSNVSKIISFFLLFFSSFFLTRRGRNFAHERSVWASQMTISKRCDVPSCILFGVCVLNFCFGRLVRVFPQTWKKFGEHSWFLIGRIFASRIQFGVFVQLRRSYIRGPKSFAQHVLGTFTLFDEHCLWLAESRALLWMKKKQK